MNYAIGIDGGIASVGYCVMALDSNNEPYRIIKLGSRVFDKAENPQDGSSLALPRREARGTRRRIRRHQHRIERIRNLIVNEGILTQNELDNLFVGKLQDIYELRCKALDKSVTNTEFARILIHIAQRRGFKSNRKSDAKDAEMGKLLEAVSENQILMETNNYRTAGEMFYKDKNYSECKRNKSDSYKATISRAMTQQEIHLIFEAQRSFGNDFANAEIEAKYTDIALSQRPFDLGPGDGSPYAGNQIEKMIGNCSLIEGEKRASKASYSFQLFTLWQNINHIKIVDEFGKSTALSDTQRRSLFELCHKSPSVTYQKIRKELNIAPGYCFNSLTYGNNDYNEIEKKSKFEYLKPYHQIRKVLDKIKKGYISSFSVDELDAIGDAFTLYKNDDSISEHLLKNGIDQETVNYLIENIGSFSKFGHLSVKACRMLLPFLEKGMTYDKACESAGIDFKGHSDTERSFLLPKTSDELDDITNPVVRRAVSQTIKVINSIIRQQGQSPTYINIELARELSKNFRERNDIKKKNEENRALNEKIKKRLEEDFKISNPTGIDIVKLKLYDEQNGIDPYSQKSFDINRLFEMGYTDVDHIIPYSISFDDSYSNKVLTFSSENRQKGDRLPLQYLTQDRKEQFLVWVNSAYKGVNSKKKNLLKEKIDDENEFKTRNLNDTKYLSKVIYNYINDHLQFEDYNGRKKHIRTVNGAVTSYMRKRWGIEKIREDGDLHHAVDASVIACVTESMIQRVSEYSKRQELQYSTGEDGSYVIDYEGVVIDRFPFPYPEFRKELDVRTFNDPRGALTSLNLPNYSQEDILEVQPCFVSRAPRHKVTGVAHKDTIRSGREDGFVISKVPLSKLKLDNNGEIENYYKPESDRLLYDALKNRLKEFGGNASKAFEEEFHKPKSDGSEGPIVKKAKLIEKSTLNVRARGKYGVADNGSMVRIDVFFVEREGYYFVPIYVSDTVKPKLPNKACVSNKPYSEWKTMSDENFIFSLYPNDLIKVKSKKDMKMKLKLSGSTLADSCLVNDAFFYFIKAGISTASITAENHDGSYVINSLGIKTLEKIEKYTVDPLGNVSKVNRENRMGFNKE